MPLTPLTSMEDFLSSHEPVRQTWCTFEISASPVGRSPAEEDFALRSVPALRSGVNSTPVTGVNSILQVPQLHEACGGGFRFQLYLNTKGLAFWRSWLDRIYDPDTDEIGLYNDIVGQGLIRLYAPGGQNGATFAETTACAEPQLVHRIRLTDVWPTAITFAGFNRDDDGSPAEYDVELQIADVTAL